MTRPLPYHKFKRYFLYSSVHQNLGNNGLKAFLMVFFLPMFVFAQTSYEEAELYFRHKKFAQAQIFFEEFLENHPGHKKTREYLGDIAAHSKKWDRAMAFYRDLAYDEKENANYHYKYGAAMAMKASSGNRLNALFYIGDIKEQLELALHLDPHHIDAHWALIEYYLQLPRVFGGSEARAMGYALDLLQVSSVDGYLAQGRIAEYTDRNRDAEQFYKRAVEVGGSPLTYRKLFVFYENNNQIDKAIEVVLRSLSQHRINDLNYEIGRICAEHNVDPSLGIESLNKFILQHNEKDSTDIKWAYYRMAQVYKNIQDRPNALLWIDKALLADRGFQEAKKEKAFILAL